MDSKLLVQAVNKYLIGLLLVGVLVFLPAGTFTYWQGWLLICILFIPMFIAGLIMMKKSPDLLRKRLNSKEEQEEQKIIINKHQNLGNPTFYYNKLQKIKNNNIIILNKLKY